MSKTASTLLIAGLLVIAALTGWGIVSAITEAFQPTRSTSGNIATQVQQIFNPTPTIYPDPVTVVLQIQALARLETSQYTIEKVITAETGQGALSALFGDRLLFVGHGDVYAGVDLSKMRATDLTVSDTGRVTMIIPAAEIFSVDLSNEKSYVYDRQTGLLTKGDVNLETAARRVADSEIQKAALEGGILEKAQANAETYLERLLLALRYTQVVFVIATPR